MTKSLLVALCFSAAAALCGQRVAASGSAFDVLVEAADLNHDGFLNTDELAGLRELALKGNGQGTACSNITELLEHAEVAVVGGAGIATTGADATKVLAEFLVCAGESIAKSLTVSMGDEDYECSNEEDEGHDDEEEEGHDDDQDEDHVDDDDEDHSGEDEMLKISVAGTNLTCRAIHSTDADTETLIITGETWLVTLGAVAVISLMSLVGALTLVCRKSTLLDTRKSVDLATDVTALAVGALVAAVFLRLLPEAMGMAMEGGNTNGSYPGLVLIAGLATAMIFEVCFHHSGAHDHDIEKAVGGPGRSLTDSDIPVEGVMAKNLAFDDNNSEAMSAADRALVANIVWGDALHNFTDGVLIAATFALCSQTIGWAVVLSVVLHELPQEFIDFVMMVRAGMSVTRALALNFLSACASFLGAIVVLASGSSISIQVQGYLIMYSTGVLLYVALVELAPRILMLHESPQSRKFMRLALMAVGVCIILGINQVDEGGCLHDDH